MAEDQPPIVVIQNRHPGTQWLLELRLLTQFPATLTIRVPCGPEISLAAETSKRKLQFMRNCSLLQRIFLSILILIAVLFTGCEKPGETPGENRIVDIQAPSSFPFTRTLTDVQGRTIEARVIGRDTATVSLIRLSDNKQFQIPMSKLSSEDRDFLLRYPIFTPATGKNASSQTTGFARFLEARIADKEAELQEVIEERSGTGRHTIRGRTLTKRFRKLNAELEGLKAELKNSK